MMGTGYWLSEAFVYDINGAPLTNGTLPGVKDIPTEFRIKFLKNNVKNIDLSQTKGIDLFFY